MTRLKGIVKSNPLIAHRDFLLDALAADDSLKQWQYELEHRRELLQRHVQLTTPFSTHK